MKGRSWAKVLREVPEGRFSGKRKAFSGVEAMLRDDWGNNVTMKRGVQGQG